MKFNIDPTKEPILKSIIYLSIPMILEMAAQNLFNLVDTYFVSRIAYEAIGAVVTSSIIITLFIGVASGISIATGMYIATYWGARKYKRSQYLYSNSTILACFTSFVLGVTTYLFLPKILMLIGLSGETFIYAKQYLKVMLLGLVMYFVFAVNGGTIRALSMPTIALKVVVIANVLNAIFDPLFIFYFGFGVSGAAISTILSLIVGTSLQFKLLYDKNFKFTGFRINKKMIKGVMKNGIYSSTQLILRTSSILVLIRIIGAISQEAISAFGVILRIYQVLLFMIFGFSNATFVMVGQNFGAKLKDRIRKSVKISLVMSFGFVLILDIIIYIFKDPIVSLFISIPSVKQVAFEILFFYAISYPFMAINTGAIQISRALHDAKRPSVIELFNLWFFQLPLAYFLSLKFSLTGIWVAIAISIYTATIANLILMNLNVKYISKKLAQQTKSKQNTQEA